MLKKRGFIRQVVINRNRIPLIPINNNIKWEYSLGIKRKSFCFLFFYCFCPGFKEPGLFYFKNQNMKIILFIIESFLILFLLNHFLGKDTKRKK